jgi:cystathionine beta-lyase/cystathionine gamma-synthase
MKTRRNRKSQQKSIHTRAVRSGEEDSRYANAITVPISQTSTFVFPSTEEIKRYTSGKLARYEYGRYGTPTQKVAEFLEGHPRIRKVFYPGLPSHPHHQIAKAQMKGFGGVVSFWVKSNLKKVNKFLDSLQSIYIGPTLGGTETLIAHPATVTYYRNTRKERYQLGITDQLCRLAVGVEDPDDLIADLDQALWRMDE